VDETITIMRIAAFAALMMLLPVSARADPPKAAVFDFELLDTSLQGEMDGARSDEQQRLIRTGEQIRKGLADSGKFTILDIAPVNDAAHAANLQACGGCDVDLAQKLGADLAITGVVQKVSNLILSLNIYLQRPARHIDERGLPRQHRRILAAHRELSAAQPAARAELRGAAIASMLAAARRASAYGRP
jgi:hypothetical protein